MITLRRKLAYHITALIVGLLLIGGAALWGLNGLHEDFGVALDGYGQLRCIYEVWFHVQTAQTLMNLDHPDPVKARREIAAAAGFFDLNFPPDQESPRDRLIRQSLRTALSGNVADRVRSDAMDEVLSQLSTDAAATRKTIQDSQKQALEQRRLTMIGLGGLAGVVMIGAILLGVMQYRAVTRPLAKLDDGVGRVAAGRFADRVPVEGPAEFAKLAENFNRMAAELDGLYTNLQRQVDQRSRELVRAERLASVGHLAAGVAHEINNPLGIITGFAEFYLDRLDKDPGQLNPEDSRQTMRVICDEAFRCKEIVEKLLSLARGSGENRRAISLAELAHDVTSTVTAVRDYRGRRLSVRTDGSTESAVDVNEGEIKQVLLNLLFNALEATDAQTGEVSVTVRAVGEWVELAVRDNGCGMTPQTLERAFEPFYTDSRISVRRGTGLGLFITHEIVQAHGGTISATSEGPGRGSEFIVRLPAAREAVHGRAHA